MAKHTKKNYYAIIKGRDAPAISSSWAVTHLKVSGYSNAKYKGFQTLNEAKSFMENNECYNYEFLDDGAEGERAPGKGEVAYYAVAAGRSPGVYEFYHDGAEKEITKYPYSCHKAFKSQKEAEEFIQKYENTLSDMMDQLRL
ncbi:hypothetical protein SBOR_10163 [Sclerotinia borealis F-4128]|uniref:Ribonuclease H1 N-terminal domain-containing protein n=1 Tax=Sclerotinia borealis (strain F-4128) TaxID=1432307 RepID=W9BXX9_SCLBF|nr:hypothetical protein SBOR_10163 [Sclerotinia borealis F-4128]